jgi:hypothetical protein
MAYVFTCLVLYTVLNAQSTEGACRNVWHVGLKPADRITCGQDRHHDHAHFNSAAYGTSPAFNSFVLYSVAL